MLEEGTQVTDAAAAEHVRAIFENCIQLAGLLSPEGIILEANPAALHFAGVKRADVLNRPLWESPWWTMVEDPNRLRSALQAAAEGEEVRYEIELRDRAGELFVFDLSLAPVIGPSDDVQAIVAEARDVTRLHRARDALRSSEATLAAILNGTLDAIVSIDEDQRIELFNRGAERIFGYDEDQVLGEKLDVLIPEHFRVAHRREVRKFGDGPDAARTMGERGEILGRRKSGELFPAEASISKASVEGRRVYTVVLRDTTERRKVEREQARLAAAEHEARLQAEAATRARDEMLRVVSHDLRNPVTGVLMGTKLLRYQLDADHPGLEVLDGIERAAERQRRLIRDLTDVANIEAGRLSVEPQPQQVGTLVRAAVRPFQPMAEARGIELDCEGLDDVPPVSADRDRIVQVMSNLLDNALEATSAGGRVEVSASLTNGSVRVVVRDTGHGLTEEEQERVFERFWRGSVAGARPGTGLGLAIARGIVESHGGQIGVESEPDAGSAFHFTLPLAGS
ncbi:MAG: PAS domain-containing sensor histidine kinase [Gemmatimonadota bacterium]